jgi:hypothetical protein
MYSQLHCAQFDVSFAFGTVAQQKSVGGLLQYIFLGNDLKIKIKTSATGFEPANTSAVRN